jgi:glycosyltransferase involved in cell wall biosynthesis
MKVLHVIPSLSQVHGGPTHALALMERALADQGVTVETATTDDDGPGRRNGKACGEALPENGALRWYFPKSFEFYKASPGFARWVTREVRHYDLVHIHALFSFVAPVAAWAARRSGVPYVIRPLGTLNAYGMGQRRPLLKGLSMRFIESRVLRSAAAVHFTSEDEAAEARQLGIPFREAIIPLAVERVEAAYGRERRSSFSALHRAPCVLFLSRVDAKKNIEGLIDAVGLLVDELPQLRVLMAGDGAPEYVAVLKARAVSAGVSKHVIWAGHLEGEAKADAFAAADVFVLPSFSENFGIAAAEALAAGVPCVLGEGVAIAKDVDQAGAGVTVAADARSIADGVRRIMGDKEGLARMAGNATRLARERFSMAAMGASLVRLYTDILNGSNGFPRSH